MVRFYDGNFGPCLAIEFLPKLKDRLLRRRDKKGPGFLEADDHTKTEASVTEVARPRIIWMGINQTRECQVVLNLSWWSTKRARTHSILLTNFIKPIENCWTFKFISVGGVPSWFSHSVLTDISGCYPVTDEKAEIRTLHTTRNSRLFSPPIYM